MFRKYAVLLNTVRELNLLVCDEGHRLKKAEGSQTFRALWWQFLFLFQSVICFSHFMFSAVDAELR